MYDDYIPLKEKKKKYTLSFGSTLTRTTRPFDLVVSIARLIQLKCLFYYGCRDWEIIPRTGTSGVVEACRGEDSVGCLGWNGSLAVIVDGALDGAWA